MLYLPLINERLKFFSLLVTSFNMPCKIFLRHDQKPQQMDSCQTKGVVVFAPSWVKEGLQILGKQLKNVQFEVHERPSLKRGRDNSSTQIQTKILESFKITEDFDDGNLVVLQKIARNEARNTNGVINTSYYPDIKNDKLIYSIKDLARQCVVVGKDVTTFCGGYKSPRVSQIEPVYIIDLAALQFQKPINSGRLVLIQESEPNKGPLDDFIFENVVGEKKKSYRDVVASSVDSDAKQRYIKHDGFGRPGKGSCFLDSKAYKKFVALDVILSGLAVAELASAQGDKVNFKFLKYGTGYFAGKFREHLDSLILAGVIDGLEALFASGDENTIDHIKHVEFPFYTSDPNSIGRLNELKNKYKVEYRFTRDDALKQTVKGKGLVTASTNCADGYVVCGKLRMIKRN